MSSEDKNKIVFVLGMHRSGTSLTAELVSELGFSVPGRPLSAIDAVNAHGFWESQEVVDINELLLVSANLKWFHVCPVGHFYKAIKPDILAEISENIRSFIRLEIEKKGNLVIKDPRLCILLPVWLEAVAELDCEIKIVYVNRHPAAVAGSLRARDGFSLFSGHLLWLYYFFSVFGCLQSRDVLYLNYEDLLVDSTMGMPLSGFLDSRNFDDESWGRICDPSLQRNFDFDFPDKGHIYNLAKYVYLIFVHGTLVSGDDSTYLSGVNFEKFIFENNDFVYALNESNNHLSEARSELVAIGGMHANALEVIRDRDFSILEASTYIDACNARLAEMENSLRDMEIFKIELEECKNVVRVLYDDIARNSSYIAECEGRIFDLEFSMAEFFSLRARIFEIENIVHQRDADALHNKSYIEKLDSRIAELHNALSEFESLRLRIAEVEDVLLQREKSVENQSRYISESNARISDLEELFSGQRSNYLSALETISDFEKKLAARNAEFFSVVEELSVLREKVENLLSWRVVRIIDNHISKGVH